MLARAAWLGSWVFIGLVAWHMTVVLRADLHVITVWGSDFQGGAWLAARQILRGASPYVTPDPQLLFRLNQAFVTPPLIGLAAVPLAHLPFGPAVAFWNLADTAGLLGALWILGIRDLRMYALAMFSAPFFDTLISGQSEGVFALMLAVAWRRRGSCRAGSPRGR